MMEEARSLNTFFRAITDKAEFPEARARMILRIYGIFHLTKTTPSRATRTSLLRLPAPVPQPQSGGIPKVQHQPQPAGFGSEGGCIVDAQLAGLGSKVEEHVDRAVPDTVCDGRDDHGARAEAQQPPGYPDDGCVGYEERHFGERIIPGRQEGERQVPNAESDNGDEHPPLLVKPGTP